MDRRDRAVRAVRQYGRMPPLWWQALYVHVGQLGPSRAVAQLHPLSVEGMNDQLM